MNGGKIQYVKYPISYNTKAIETLIKRAMDKGFYEGVNLSLSYCDDCGHQELNMDVCPKCGSKNLTKIDRMNGYLSYSRVKGDTRLNEAKMEEIKDRVSMQPPEQIAFLSAHLSKAKIKSENTKAMRARIKFNGF